MTKIRERQAFQTILNPRESNAQRISQVISIRRRCSLNIRFSFQLTVLCREYYRKNRLETKSLTTAR